MAGHGPGPRHRDGLTVEPSDRDLAGRGDPRPDGAPGPARVVVVGADAGRLAQYRSALGLARVPFRATLDLQDAEALIERHPLEVLVLDLGLPRLALLQLYGVARGAEGGADVQVLFVGQDGETTLDDHFLPGEPSPVTVASRVSDLLVGVPEPPVLDLGEDGGDPATAAAEAPDPGASAAPTADARSAPTADLPAAAGPASAPVADPAAARTLPGPQSAATVRPTHDDPLMAGAVDGPEPGAQEGPTIADLEPASDGPEPLSRRSYLTLVRIGLLLFVLGLLLYLVRLEWNPPPITPPPLTAPTVGPDAAPTPAGQFPWPAPGGPGRTV